MKSIKIRIQTLIEGCSFKSLITIMVLFCIMIHFLKAKCLLVITVVIVISTAAADDYVSKY